MCSTLCSFFTSFSFNGDKDVTDLNKGLDKMFRIKAFSEPGLYQQIDWSRVRNKKWRSICIQFVRGTVPTSCTTQLPHHSIRCISDFLRRLPTIGVTHVRYTEDGRWTVVAISSVSDDSLHQPAVKPSYPSILCTNFTLPINRPFIQSFSLLLATANFLSSVRSSFSANPSALSESVAPSRTKKRSPDISKLHVQPFCFHLAI